MSLAGDFRFFFFGVHQAEFLPFVAEGIAADVQEPGGAGLVAIDCCSASCTRACSISSREVPSGKDKGGIGFVAFADCENSTFPITALIRT